MPAQTSFSGNLSGGGSSVDLTGTASSDAGVLKGSISTIVTSGAPPLTGIVGEAVALMVDTVTISDPSLNGETGSLVLGLSADATGSGSQLVSPGVYTTADVSLYAGAAVSGFPLARTGYFVDGSLSVPSYLGPAASFTFGEPFSIEIYFEATSGASCTTTAACATWNSNGVAASVNASDTVLLNSFNVYGNNGASISPSDWSVISASGLQYGPSGVVPEPPSWVPSIAILAVIGLIKGRWQRGTQSATAR